MFRNIKFPAYGCRMLFFRGSGTDTDLVTFMSIRTNINDLATSMAMVLARRNEELGDIRPVETHHGTGH